MCHVHFLNCIHLVLPQALIFSIPFSKWFSIACVQIVKRWHYSKSMTRIACVYRKIRSYLAQKFRSQQFHWSSGLWLLGLPSNLFSFHSEFWLTINNRVSVMFRKYRITFCCCSKWVYSIILSTFQLASLCSSFLATVTALSKAPLQPIRQLVMNLLHWPLWSFWKVCVLQTPLLAKLPSS